MKTWEKIAWSAWFITLAVLMQLLAGCSDPHKNQHCVQTQREVWYYQHTKVTSWYSITTPVYHNVCTEWVPNT